MVQIVLGQIFLLQQGNIDGRSADERVNWYFLNASSMSAGTYRGMGTTRAAILAGSNNVIVKPNTWNKGNRARNTCSFSGGC